MRVGLGLLNAGETGRYSSLSRLAQHAEALGYDSLWVTEREPFPLATQSRSPMFSGELHVSRKPIDRTLDALAIAAINTDRIRLGISLPNVPFYSPTDVGQSLAALDVLSDGRVQVGLGLGWTAAEFEMVGQALSRLETPANEFVRALRTVWDGHGNGFSGEHYSIPGQPANVTPVQRPYPPILLTAFAPAAVQKTSTLLRGGSPLSAMLSSEEMAEALLTITGAGAGAGLSGGFELVVRAVVRLTDGPIGEARALFVGSLEQLRDDIGFVQSLGVAELQFDLSQMPFGLESAQLFDIIGQLRALVGASALTPVGTAA